MRSQALYGDGTRSARWEVAARPATRRADRAGGAPDGARALWDEAPSSARGSRSLLRLDGLDICVEQIAPPRHGEGRPTLIFLHEEVGSIPQWEAFPHQLSAITGCPALVYDRPGSGESDPAEGPLDLDGLQGEVERLGRLMALLSIERAVLIGHGEGGVLALLGAASLADQVCGIVTLDTPCFMDLTLRRFIATVDDFAEVSPLLEQLDRFHGERAGDVLFDWLERWLSPASSRWDLRPQLARVRAPLLALQSAQSLYLSDAQHDALVSGVAGPTSTSRPGCAHSPHRNARAQTLDAIACFIRAAQLDLRTYA